MTIDVLGVGLELPYDLTAADDAEKWGTGSGPIEPDPAGNRRKRETFYRARLSASRSPRWKNGWTECLARDPAQRYLMAGRT